MVIMNTDKAFTDVYLTVERMGKSILDGRENKLIILTIPFPVKTIPDCVKIVHPFVCSYMSEYRRLFIDGITQPMYEKPWSFSSAKVPLKDGNIVKFYETKNPYYVVEEYSRTVEEAGSKEYLIEKYHESSNNWNVYMTTDDIMDCSMYLNNDNFRVLKRGCLLCKHIMNGISYIDYMILSA